MLKKCFVLLALVLVVAVVTGCTHVRPSDRVLIHTYRLASDEYTTRITDADPSLPPWVVEGARADNQAFRAIDALAQGKKVADLE